MKTSVFWRVVYKVYPTLTLRVLEKIGVHNFRCSYHVGYLNPKSNFQDIAEFFKRQGFEHTPISWIDPGEILNMRKIENGVFQYHLRIFVDREIRGHYEYTPEDAPFRHMLKKKFTKCNEYFEALLGSYLATKTGKRRFEAVSK